MTDPDRTRDPVAELETFIAETEARGEQVPPEARLMLARLRELLDAVRGLSASFEAREEAESTPETPPDDGAAA